MTGNLLIDSLISIAGILVMVVVVRLVFPKPAAKVTEALARERLALDEPDFAPRAWLIDGEGRAALAEGAAGDFVLIERLGLDLVTRRFKPGAAKIAVEEGALVVKLPDHTTPKVAIAGGDATGWAMKLNPESDT